ncbi:RNA polymerase subunit sigma-70 [Cryptosporangium arvum]|uniref:RNA polymerase sigma factor n=1 Tax=Cryptosporangium arvum DSM 44712 TaxID=927661 RepID=A0A010ZT00_9ACTN|nr:RNA polymerase subunit sigma-70 [Cryptosporangium arvum]EXG81809.1 RNA polymerase sigma-70 factor, TIGR02960 family [Cryptosporangium arvum DSM 44712]
MPSLTAEELERHRRELRVHCYRLLGSYTDAEDLVQETFLRAWTKRDTFEGRSTLRAWLYRIATNACLDWLDGKARRVLPHQLTGPSDPSVGLAPRTDVPWLQPFPDHELAAPDESGPEAVAVGRETIELAFLAALQLLPARQRAALVLRDVHGWPASDVAGALGLSVPAVNSALQRARATLRESLPERRADWRAATEPTAEEKHLLHRYLDAVRRGDVDAVAALLAEDIRTTMPPWPMWFRGREHVRRALASSWDPALEGYVGEFVMRPVGANRQPAVASWTRRPGEPAFRPFAISVMEIRDGFFTGMTAFHDPALFPAFGLPAEILPADR